MLELRGITKKYSIFPVVKDVSFTVQPGEILGYLGPNGAGKTTTIKILAGLLEPTDGEILLDGRSIKKDRYFLNYFVICGVLFMASRLYQNFYFYRRQPIVYHEEPEPVMISLESPP